MRARIVLIDGDDGATCPVDDRFEHRSGWPYLGACVPKNLSETTGRAKGHHWELNAETGRYDWMGGCNPTEDCHDAGPHDYDRCVTCLRVFAARPGRLPYWSEASAARVGQLGLFVGSGTTS